MNVGYAQLTVWILADYSQTTLVTLIQVLVTSGMSRIEGENRPLIIQPQAHQPGLLPRVKALHQ